MHVLVKNLCTNRCSLTTSNKLFVVNAEQHTYTSFKPSSITDFKSNTKYGIIVNDSLVYNYILAMSESEEEIQEYLSDPRKHKIKNPKRLSYGEPQEPLGKFKLRAEKDSCSSDKKGVKLAEKNRKCSAERKIVEKYVKASQDHSKSKAEDFRETSPPLKRKDEDHIGPQPDAKIPKIDVCKDSCHACLELQTKVTDLQDKLKFVMDSLQESEEALIKSKEEVKHLTDKLQTVDVSKASTFKTIGTCPLSAMTSALSKSDESIDCGAQVFVMKASVTDVEISSEKFSSRVRGLCELFWPQRVHLMRLTADSKADTDSEVIKECHIDAMTNLLNTMTWTEEQVQSAYTKAFPKKQVPPINLNHAFNKAIVRTQLRHTTYNVRDNMQRKAGKPKPKTERNKGQGNAEAKLEGEQNDETNKKQTKGEEEEEKPEENNEKRQKKGEEEKPEEKDEKQKKGEKGKSEEKNEKKQDDDGFSDVGEGNVSTEFRFVESESDTSIVASPTK